MNYNKVILCGNVVKKPELKTLENGTIITSLTLAINKVWKDSNTGEKKESTDFLDVTVFGKQAESCAQYLEKGQNVMVEGRLQNRAVEDRGEKRYKTGVLAEQVTFGPKAKSNTSEESTNGSKSSVGGKKYGPEGVTDTVEYPADDINPDDIPF